MELHEEKKLKVIPPQSNQTSASIDAMIDENAKLKEARRPKSYVWDHNSRLCVVHTIQITFSDLRKIWVGYPSVCSGTNECLWEEIHTHVAT